MSECRGQYFSENNSLIEASAFDPLKFNNGSVIYEVVRIHDGICLFLEDHVERLYNSIGLSRLEYRRVNLLVLRKNLHDLISHNGFQSGNIKIVVHFMPGALPCLFAYFIPHFYPSAAMYRDGVNTELFKAIRINPNAKIAHSDARDAIGRFLRSRKLYEVLLVNNEDRLTEGSKSNVFFIKGQEIVTPPGEQVLKGITRSKVIDLCHQFTFTFTERIISMNQLSEFDAAFLTGTSPKILPVRRIGTITYKPDHPIINSLSCAYDALVSAYIQDQLKAF